MVLLAHIRFVFFESTPYKRFFFSIQINLFNDEIDFQKKKIAGFDEDQAEILTTRFIQKITTQFVKHLKDEETSVSQSLQVINKVFQS